ncbi:DUF3231 family protein [Paenisporosarcina sp. TG20]|uniref:DUF3231 family protein n=1 Tax=Paenisporosarcina sp. TG20 TaxID=1211706 RepID=UPI000312670A|nr:DUF3231 family protein [Paenisporosarcina sp. TG20]
MKTKHNIELTSAEIASLWTSYQQDSLSICTIEFFLLNIKDREISTILKHALKLSQAHIQKLEAFFQKEEYPIPHGFSLEEDVNLESPRLFADDFYLFYIQNMGKIGMEGNTIALCNSARLDISEYYTECLNESSKLYNMSTGVMLSKGLFIRSPYIPKPKMVEYVQKQSYLAGKINRRPLNVIETSNIYFNLIQNQLGRTLAMGFSQVAKSQSVRDYMIRGMDISDKQVEVFGSILSEDHLPSASSWSTLPTDSTVAAFSDKLLMAHFNALNAAGIGHYGRSLSQSPRRDLGAHYIRLMAEIVKFAEDGANIMIDNSWLEQPPLAADRNKLAKHKKKEG